MQSVIALLQQIWPYAIAVLVFLTLIVIHEFGHFLAAKCVGVRVNEFAVGFGPCLLSRQGKETKYRLNLIPFGGYCAMEGESTASDDSRAFCNQKPWKRLIVVSMGAVFNLLFGLILVAILLANSRLLGTTVVAKFDEDAVSPQSGLMVYDEIIEANGRPIRTGIDLSYAFTNVKDGQVDLKVKRDGQTIVLDDVTFVTEEYEGISYVKMDFSVFGLSKTPWRLLVWSVKTTASYVRVVWYSLLDLLAGRYGISAVSGPVGVTATIGAVARKNLLDLLPIMALITINLGVFNLLPVPALDGGRIFFLFIELLWRRPIPAKYENAIHAVGFIVLLLLMGLIAFKDIWVLLAHNA